MSDQLESVWKEVVAVIMEAPFWHFLERIEKSQEKPDSGQPV
jgi:hypothetical protein